MPVREAPVPDEIIQIDAVPRRLSGKVLEVSIKPLVMGTPAEQAASRESLANPAHSITSWAGSVKRE